MESFITISLSLDNGRTKFNLISYNEKIGIQRIFDDSMDVKHAPQKLEIPRPSENIKMTNVMTSVTLLFEQPVTDRRTLKKLIRISTLPIYPSTRVSFDNKEKFCAQMTRIFELFPRSMRREKRSIFHLSII